MTRTMALNSETRLGEGTWQTQDPMSTTMSTLSTSSLRNPTLAPSHPYNTQPENDIWKRNWLPSDHEHSERPPLRRATVSHGSSTHSIPTPPSSQPPSPPSPSRKPPSSRRSSDYSPPSISSLPPELASFLAPHLTEARRYWDSHTNTLHWSLDRLEVLLGYTPNQVSPSTAWWHDRIHPNDKSNVLASLQVFHDSDATPFWTHEYRILAADDTYLLVTDQIRALERSPRTGTLLRSVGVLYSNTQHELVSSFLQSSSPATVVEPSPRPPDDFTPIRISMTHSPPLISRWPSNQTQPPRVLSPITPADVTPESDTAALLRTVTDNSTSGLFLTDSNGHATYMNRAAQEITGWTLDDLRGQPLHNSLHRLRADGTPYPLSECSIGRTYNANIPIRNQADMFVHRDGHLFPVVWSVAPLAGKGKELGVVIDFRDVTSERKMEEEKLRLHVEAESERTKMAESESHRMKLAEFVDFVCHEIRNPLHGIAASAEFLADCMTKIERELDSTSSTYTKTRPILQNSYSLPVTPLPLSPPSPDNSAHRRSQTTGSSASPTKSRETRELLSEMQLYVRSIRECCSHQAVITNNVLDLSRLESGKVELLSEIFDPSEVAARCLAMLSARIAEKNIAARLEVPESSFLVKGDPMRYSQVVMNLAGNAVKFTEPGKEITIVVSPPDAKQGSSSSSIVFSSGVRDTGIGMTPSEVSSLFVRFGQLNKRISRDYGGSGLGLNISNELVHLLGGEFEVESEKGRGTMMRFSVRMKRVDEVEERMWREKRERVRKEEEEAARAKELNVVESTEGELVRIEDLTSPIQGDTTALEGPAVLLAPAIAEAAVVSMPRPSAPVAGTSTSTTGLSCPILPEARNTASPIVIPTAESSMPPAPSPSLLPSPNTASPVPKFSHVLIAEDNVINQMVLATYLKKLGYEHTVCSNGKEAVNHFMAGKGDVIIMDIEMPIMDGREATRLIRAHEDAKAFDDLSTSNQLRPKMKRKPSTCIIALSGNARPGLMQDAYNTGLNDYLTKPCSMDELARMLTKWEHDRARRTAAATVDAVGSST